MPPREAWARLRGWAGGLKREALAVYLASRDPRTPWAARLLAAAVVAYALSPLDLIPDFVPVLGYLDDLLLVPLGLALAIRLIPAPVLTDCRERARRLAVRPTPRWTVGLVVATWLGAGGLLVWLVAGAIGGR